MSYTYVIIDSDVPSCLTLKSNLDAYNDFEFLDVMQDSNTGMNLILKKIPNLVFINFSNNDARSLFKMVAELYQYSKHMPIFIGLASSKKYAYNALKYGFFDYLLSPYNDCDIRKTVSKLRLRHPLEKVPTTICLKTYRDFHYLDTSDILYLQSNNNTTNFILADGDNVSVYKTLKSFEKTLPKNFIRIHQSYILNSEYVSRINYGKSICTLKNNYKEIPFSKSYKARIEELQTLLSNNAIKHIN